MLNQRTRHAMSQASFRRRLLMPLVAGLLLWTLSTESALARRVALVIGNSAYRSVAELPNPARDAKAMADLFKKAHFEVVEARVNVEYLDFKRALRRFEDAATDADIAVVYYAGHGIEIGGRNYLIPVNAKLASDRDAQDEAIPLDRLVLSTEPAAKLRLIILDACRDNPFARTMKKQRYVRSLPRGLSQVEPTRTNTLIAYASKAGSTAEDGDGDHSPFTLALLKNLAVPGLDIRLAFGRVRDDVLKRTGNRQEPFVYGSLGGSNIALVPLPAAPPAPSVADVKGDYDLVERIGTKKAWEVFLATHENGLYADLARAQLAKIADQERTASKRVQVAQQTRGKPAAPPAGERSSAEKQKTKVAALELPKTADVEKAASEEARAWDRIKNSSDAQAFRDFIERYPSSTLVLTARKHLSALEAAARASEERTRDEREAKRAQIEEAACRNEEAKLAGIKGSADQAAARIRLEELRKSLGCERLRPAVVAALEGMAKPSEKIEAVPEPKPEKNSRELVLAAQEELKRIGCFTGSVDGIFGSVTRAAVGRYLDESDRRSGDDNVTGDLVTSLKKERSRVCPLQCSSSEVRKGDTCVAEKAPPSRAKRRDASRHRESKPPRRTRYSSQPRPRQEAATRRPMGGGVIGVGF